MYYLGFNVCLGWVTSIKYGQFVSVLLFCCCIFTPKLYAETQLPIGIVEYRPHPDLGTSFTGELVFRGSTRIEPLIRAWFELFQGHYPQVTLDMKASGSKTGPPALAERVANLVGMSRMIKAKEIQAFRAKTGYPPTEIRIALDALAVYVNQLNDLNQLTLPQLDAIFSSTRRCGAQARLKTWDAVGHSITNPIVLHGLHKKAGAHAFFNQIALCSGIYNNTVIAHKRSDTVTQAIANDRLAIGYAAYGSMTHGVKPLAIAIKARYPYYMPNWETISQGDYPLTRFLYLYVNKAPNTRLPTLIQEFLKFAFSTAGQKVVITQGAIPLPAGVIGQELQAIREVE